ncbi:receptor expression-enhancing protein 4-like [Ornithodoros turicata]|uniref:receptor expression-enhancing protein 4-like n=1 Tax=Ornithodoros turicata TaxID=34597 RepID=UPI003139EBD4
MFGDDKEVKIGAAKRPTGRLLRLAEHPLLVSGSSFHPSRTATTMIWVMLVVMSLLSATFCRVLVLTVGALYPAYASCKAVDSRNARQYVHWMMYWIVLASFLTMEPIVDCMLANIPFYNQLKMGIVFWLQSPTNKGASLIFRKVILPQFTRCAAEIDLCVAKINAEAACVGSTAAKYFVQVIIRSVLDHMRDYSIADPAALPSSQNEKSERSAQEHRSPATLISSPVN